MTPLGSVLLEAYNEEYNSLTPPADTLNAILQQDFPLEQVELVFIGSPQQIEYWKGLAEDRGKFFQVRTVPVRSGDSHYWQLKNKAAEVAEGQFVALIDCDTVPGPHWLSALVAGLQSGADVCVGPSQYRTERFGPDSPWMLAASLPSWAFQLARSATPAAGALLAHNVAFRRDVLLQHPFRNYNRSFPSSLLYFELVRLGAKIAYQ